MQATGRPRVKVCCIMSVAEAALAVRAGASALGLVSSMPSGPGVIPEALIRAIARTVPPGVSAFLLTSLSRPDAIAEQVRAAGVDTIQLCDAVAADAYAELRAALPNVSLVQVVHVTGPGALVEARRVAPHVDALLLDSGNPERAVKELGGTGRRHDWEISRRIREEVGVPLFLAGGLRADNVREAVARVSPFGLDVCSGVRTGGALDAAKLDAFVAAALA